MISFKNINKNFGKLKALREVDLDIQASRSYALLGPNGSGKTTLIKTFLGLVVPSSGSIMFKGEQIIGQWEYRNDVGYMPQIGRYPDNISIGQLIDMMKNIRKHDGDTDDELIDAFKLYKLYDKKMHTLSGGTRQKVSAALAFLFHPPVLILDEPTAGLDPVSVEILKEKILTEKMNGKSILITSHILTDLDDLASDIIYMFEGKVHYNNSVNLLKEETNEKRLNKAIATFIKQKALLDSLTE